MLVSLNWLKEYVDIDGISPEELAEKVTKSGIEVDSVEYIAENSSNVVIGYIESCEKHPNADKLNLCQVNVGEETLQIICGAPNVRQGQKVAVAKPGAVLPGNFKIKKAKLRGVESFGMICSLQELGFDEKHIAKEYAEGIFVFPEDAPVGESVEPLLNSTDAVLEFDLTPNRADCLSMLGVAYEVGALLDKPVNLPSEKVNATTEKAADYISVKVDDEKLNPYYGAFVIKDVEIKASPLWMQNYLLAAGIRPINNVVDITNYVLLEYGQPLHAFDYDRLNSKEIVVRKATEGEKIITLDDVERTLTSENLVITNGKEPVALAGVMGGANSEVTSETTNILLEAAYFDSISIRKTVKATGLRSEASTRYEKGIDPNRVRQAGLRACHLLEKYAGGKVLEGVVEFDKLDRSEQTVAIDTKTINHRLGTTITSDEIAKILERLQFNYERNDEQFTVYAPTRRGDIAIFEDMLEEVARIYGYDNLPFTLPTGTTTVGGLTKKQQLRRSIKNYLEGVGLLETRTYSLTSETYVRKLVSPEIKELNPTPISLAMPMSEEHKYLRLSILPELLKTVSYNLARNQANLAYYEIGSIFVTDEQEVTKQPDEQLRVSGVLTGKWLENLWQQENKKVDFYVVKGIVEGLFNHLELPLRVKQVQIPDMHPGRTASLLLGDKLVGFIGQLHPALEKELDLKETYVFDINVEAILETHHHEPSYMQIPRYPSVTRDIAFILDDRVAAGDVKETIEEVGAPLVKSVQVFDVYKGDHLEEGKKSIAYSLLYQDPEKTLVDEEVENSYQAIIAAVSEKHGAYVRS
ncbi:phenylalanine--tRNA ligase subunit beta [Ornithinibacillus halotolerans]|uniref:Phenylalanine--tRNA ligase beta subunit n=1 Tax=Ornithinibacillus halotolerans TaxID=1274357 RepID=A0A916WC57_9BACI|nr:phenylalanine--tRNA ligase subunit beta [Ornithinibacillus halotolerans]GGA86305.1 phenylalanine--tRNA ligase beta subunit [Ornithinibacillus halotolerans]